MSSSFMTFFKYFLTASLIFSVNSLCAPGDHTFGDLCYAVSNSQLSYKDAVDNCHSLSMNLAVIHTSSQASFLANAVKLQANSNIKTFWIGLSRPTISSTYQWDDGTPLVWSNFDSSYPQSSLYVAENTVNARWQTLDGVEKNFFACSYDPNFAIQTTTSTAVSTTNPTTTAEPTTTAPKSTVTCLFMYDGQSSGIDDAAIVTYEKYFDFAVTIGNKLAAVTQFSGNIDNFGYGPPADHSNYIVDDLAGLNSVPFPIETDDDLIDLDLKDVDSSLKAAVWVPPVEDNTCLVFISAAAEADFGGTTIQTSYNSFKTVVGATVGGATLIPGLTNVIAASTLSDADADAIVNMILENLPTN